MTNEEAIEILKYSIGVFPATDRGIAALDLAVKALSQQTEDAISRNNAITSICQWGTTLERIGKYQVTVAEMKQNCADMLCNLPSVTPKQRTGRWEEIKSLWGGKWEMIDNYKCSVCGELDNGGNDYKYCPNCGAKMEGQT